VQWDNHETRNNWYPGETIGIEAYKVKSASLLSAYARQAMFEYNPMRLEGEDTERVYRRVAYGPALDIFMLDERSYQSPVGPQSGFGLSRGRSARSAQALAASVDGDMEADRQRHADRHRRTRSQSRCAKGHVRSLGQR
jgi:alkaline phosphatase D